jgi:hypothetical protein
MLPRVLCLASFVSFMCTCVRRAGCRIERCGISVSEFFSRGVHLFRNPFTMLLMALKSKVLLVRSFNTCFMSGDGNWWRLGGAVGVGVWRERARGGDGKGEIDGGELSQHNGNPHLDPT